VPNEDPPFIRFARKKHGVGLNLWDGEGEAVAGLLQRAGLSWPVDPREVLVPTVAGNHTLAPARRYRALVRPDTEQIMSVVTTSYSVAQNQWIALRSSCVVVLVSRRR
jgi:hypothetical protein